MFFFGGSLATRELSKNVFYFFLSSTILLSMCTELVFFCRLPVMSTHSQTHLTAGGRGRGETSVPDAGRRLFDAADVDHLVATGLYY